VSQLHKSTVNIEVVGGASVFNFNLLLCVFREIRRIQILTSTLRFTLHSYLRRSSSVAGTVEERGAIYIPIFKTLFYDAIG